MKMKCLRCKTEDIKVFDEEVGYVCENCGATYRLIDDSGE